MREWISVGGWRPSAEGRDTELGGGDKKARRAGRAMMVWRPTGSEAEHLVEIDFDGFDIGAEQAGDGRGVEFLGVADDDGHKRAAFDVFGVEGAEVVEGDATDLLGELGAEVTIPAPFFNPIAHHAGQAAEGDVVAVAGDD